MSVMSKNDRVEIARQKHEKLPYYPKGNGFDWVSFRDACQTETEQPFVIGVQKTPKYNEVIFTFRGDLPTVHYFGITTKRKDGKLGRLCFGRKWEENGFRVFYVDGFDGAFLRTPPEGYDWKVVSFETDKAAIDAHLAKTLEHAVVGGYEELKVSDEDAPALIEFRNYLRGFMNHYGPMGPEVRKWMDHLSARLAWRKLHLKREIDRRQLEIRQMELEIEQLK